MQQPDANLQKILVKQGRSIMNENGGKKENTRNGSPLHGHTYGQIRKSKTSKDTKTYSAKQKHRKATNCMDTQKALCKHAVTLEAEALRQNNFTKDPYIIT